MDYASIIPTSDATGNKDIKHFHVPKKDNKDILLGIQDEIEKAKAFLCIPSPVINVTLFDHLAAVLAKIIREKVENSVDIIESISQSVKRERHSKTSALIEKSKPNEKLLKYIMEMQDLFKAACEHTDANFDIKPPEDDEDEPTEEEDIMEADSIEEDADLSEKKEEFNLRNVMPDLCCHTHYFREAGIGLSCSEILKINVSMKTLAVSLKLKKLRFWGKFLGIHNDYYIAETPFRKDIKQEEFGFRCSVVPAEEDAIIPESELEEEGDQEDEEEEAVDEIDEGVENEETEKPELKYVVIPPLPPLNPPTINLPPADENGTGVNKDLYFVCTEPGYPWVCLPRCTPEQIIAARQMKKVLLGKLDAEVRGYPLFPGKEAHYLRAQIARISAGTRICPKNYYHIPGPPETSDVQETAVDEVAEEEEEAPEEPEEPLDVVQMNPDYQALSVDELFAEGVKQWVHEKPAILPLGCSSLNLEVKEEKEEGEETEEAEAPEAPEEASQEEKPVEEADEETIIEEKQIPLLRCISLDKCGGGLVPWTIKLCSNLLSEIAVLLLRSNIWPGAHTYYNGRSYEHIYIGHGQKYSVRHYAPVLPVAHPSEYPYGSDITEHDYSLMPPEEKQEPDSEEPTEQPAES